MTGRTKMRVREIHRRVRRKKRRRERCVRSCLTVMSLLLLISVTTLVRSVQTPGVSTVSGSYSTVLLRDGAGAYILVGIAAFVLGVIVTVLCVRYREKTERQMKLTKKEERV